MTAESNRAPAGRVTVGITSLNEERTIGAAIEALIKESEHIQSELVVVAGGTDRTVDIARSLLSGNPNSRVIVDSRPRGKPAALNTLVSQASGDILVLSDGDIVVAPGSVAALLRAFDSESVGCAGGRVMGSSESGNPVERACDIMTEMMHLSRRRMYLQKRSIDIASGNLLAVRKEFFPVIPEDTNSDDGYISLWVRNKGLSVAYVEEAVAFARFPKTLSDFLRQKIRTRYGHLQLRSQFPGSLSRTFGTDFAEWYNLRAIRKLRKYSPSVSFLAIIMTFMAWILAYSRFRYPWIFRRRLWEPVSSTK